MEAAQHWMEHTLCIHTLYGWRLPSIGWNTHSAYTQYMDGGCPALDGTHTLHTHNIWMESAQH